MEEDSPDSPDDSSDHDALSPEPFRRESQTGRCYLPCRYALTILSASGFCVLFLMRVNLSVAIVAMVNSTYADANASANNPECQRDKVKTTRVKVSLLVLGLTLLKKVIPQGVFLVRSMNVINGPGREDRGWLELGGGFIDPP